LEDDTLEALQAKVGIDNSAVTTSLDYILKNTTAGHDHDGTDSKKVVVTNIDITGISASQLVRVNSGATALEGLTPPSGDLVGTTATQTESNKTFTSPLFQGTVDGWISANETWTYASASTITVPTGAASKYAVGDRIKWTQTTVKYGVIVTVADTLLTIAVNTDYVVTNAAITLNYYSHELSPIGYPHWFNYTLSFTGFSADPASPIAKFKIFGKACLVNIRMPSMGTSNTSGFTVSLPATAKNTTSYNPIY